MAPELYPSFPPQLTQAQEEYLLTNVKDWALSNGLVVKPSPFIIPGVHFSDVLGTVAPVTLFPSLFPRLCFEEAQKLQKAYNVLYAAIATDEQWLGGIIQELVEVDDFIAKLWDIHIAVKKEGYTQTLNLGLFRSDYMVHVDPTSSDPTPEIRQVEFNTIASSFGGLANRVSELHFHLQNCLAYPPYDRFDSDPANLPISNSIIGLSNGLKRAHDHYLASSKPSGKLPLCILFVVQDPENNVFDQRFIENELIHNHYKVFRLPFDEVIDRTSIPSDDPSRPLIYRPPHRPDTPFEAAVVYYRAGYSPDEYNSKKSWEARLLLERSKAIKCPSVLTHLAGSKKVQQVLATPSSKHLERFIPDPVDAERIRKTFAAIYPMDDSPAGKIAKGLAVDEEKCKGYVLKPQREGGGNNVYREAIPPFLRKLGDEKRYRGYILMELIEPPQLRNTILRHGEVKSGEVVNELGIYGACVWDAKPLGASEASIGSESSSFTIDGGQQRHMIDLGEGDAGFLLRTKGRESEEGGIAAGFGALDSPCLV